MYTSHTLNKKESHFKSITPLQEAPSYARLKASYTVEAAITVPIMAMILVMVLFGFRILQVQTCVESALDKASRQTAVYAQAVDKEETLLLCASAIAKTAIKKYKAPTEYVKGGLTGITFLSSKVSGDYINLVAVYKMKFPFPFFYKKTVTVTQSAKSRKWTGYDKSKSEEDKETYVYITPTGKAYHSSLSCSYLKLSIQAVSYTSIKNKRSKNGNIYYACPLCAKGVKSGTVYITDYGENYHKSLSCSGLKRTIYHIPLEQAIERGYHSCGKCY
ncbi:MAG: pilus assembly protein [Eubacterium sp.]|nr:pilus assembly protein [Eubacterium sp.]